MLKQLPFLILLFALAGLMTGPSAAEKPRTGKQTKGDKGRDKEIVNVVEGMPSHVMVKPGQSFASPDTVQVSATYTSNSVTADFDGGKLPSVRGVKNGVYSIRLKCTRGKAKKTMKQRDPTTTGMLTVTLTDGTNTDVTTLMDVIGDPDPDACP